MGFKKETGGLETLGSLGEVNPLGEAVLETGCFFLVEADGLRGCYAARKIGGLEEVPRRKVGVNEGTLVEKENGFDSFDGLEFGGMSEVEQTLRLLIQEKGGRLRFLVDLGLFLVDGFFDFILKCGERLVEVFLGQVDFVLDIPETQVRQNSGG
jgi:hypothetical protein